MVGFLWRRVGRAAVLAMLLGACGIGCCAAADEREEVLIGTFHLRPPSVVAPAVHPASMQPSSSQLGNGPQGTPPIPARPSAPVGEQRPDQMLGAAMGLLGAGDRIGAQRQLEVLVGRYPDAPETAHARRYLGQIYNTAVSAAAAAPNAQHAEVKPSGPAIGEGWRAEVRRGPPIEERFAIEVPDRVFFSSGAADLGVRARNVLATQARWLLKHESVGVVVEGHADEPGSLEENRALSMVRAEAVRQRLIEEGVAAPRIKAVAKGRSERVAECEGSDCAAQNRRAITLTVPSGQSSVPPGPMSVAPPAPSAPVSGLRVPAAIRTSGGDPSER